MEDITSGLTGVSGVNVQQLVVGKSSSFKNLHQPVTEK